MMSSLVLEVGGVWPEMWWVPEVVVGGRLSGSGCWQVRQASRILLRRFWFLMLRHAMPCNVLEARHAAKNMLRKAWSAALSLGSRATMTKSDVVGSPVRKDSRAAVTSLLCGGGGGGCWSSAASRIVSVEGSVASGSSMDMRSQSK